MCAGLQTLHICKDSYDYVGFTRIIEGSTCLWVPSVNQVRKVPFAMTGNISAGSGISLWGSLGKLVF